MRGIYYKYLATSLLFLLMSSVSMAETAVDSSGIADNRLDAVTLEDLAHENDSLMLELDSLKESVAEIQDNINQINASEENVSWPGICLIIAVISAFVAIFYSLKTRNKVIKQLKQSRRTSGKPDQGHHQSASGKEPQSSQKQHVISSSSTECEKEVHEANKAESRERKQSQSLNTATKKKEAPHEPQIIRKYCSFLVYEDGTLKTDGHLMTDDSSKKLFQISYKETGNTATYTINALKKAYILEDLQTFQNYTEPFIISETPKDIHVDQVGLLSRKGYEWVVTKKLKVSFN